VWLVKQKADILKENVASGLEVNQQAQFRFRIQRGYRTTIFNWMGRHHSPEE